MKETNFSESGQDPNAAAWKRLNRKYPDRLMVLALEELLVESGRGTEAVLEGRGRISAVVSKDKPDLPGLIRAVQNKGISFEQLEKKCKEIGKRRKS